MIIFSGKNSPLHRWWLFVTPFIAMLLMTLFSAAPAFAAANPVSVSITSPAQGAVLFVSGTAPLPGSGVRISARSSSGMITGVSLTMNGLSLGSGSLISGSTNTYLVPWYPSTAGFFTFVATATDSTGAQATSTPVRVTVEQPGFAVHYVMTSQWQGGFNSTITIKSGEPISGWQLSFVFPGNQQITSGWGGNFSQQGNKVTVTNASYDGSIAPGGIVTFGFNASWSGSNPAPTSFVMNGIFCTSTFTTLCALGTTLPPPA